MNRRQRWVTRVSAGALGWNFSVLEFEAANGCGGLPRNCAVAKVTSLLSREWGPPQNKIGLTVVRTPCDIEPVEPVCHVNENP